MKNRILIALIAIASLGMGISCTPNKTSKTAILDREAFIDSIQQPNAQVADIRTPEEHHEEGNFEQAQNIDFLADDFYEQMEEHFDKNKPLYIHCKRGKKSHKAAQKLIDMGFTEVYELQGGFDDWKGDEE